MAFNRDIAILLLKALNKKNLRIADILAGSGIRGARFLKELSAAIVEHIAFNDIHKDFKKTITTTIKLNKLPQKKISVCNKDASLFLLESQGFDYIDIDPFGSPNQYVDAAIKRISREGILAITATDTSALAGSHHNACTRKYWAEPHHNELMHEIGIRILIRKVQLIGAQYDKALEPLFVHATKHYYRIYVVCSKGKKAVDSVLKQHLFFLFCHQCTYRTISRTNQNTCPSCKHVLASAGPLWTGLLWRQQLVKRMCVLNKNDGLKSFLKIILNESCSNKIGFYALPRLCSLLHVAVPPRDDIIDFLYQKRFSCTPTHFSVDGLKTEAPLSLLRKFINDWNAIKKRSA